jgi:hypothetical protein
MTLTLLTEYQVEHLQDVFSAYRRAITRELKKGFKSRARRDLLLDKLTITDEIMNNFNILEGEYCNH